MDGIIYILKFDPPFWHARYYVGWCNPRGLWNRLRQHRTGQGAKITRAAVKQGHRLVLVADFPGTRDDERAIKKRKNTPKFVQQLARHGLLTIQRQDRNVTIRADNVTRSARNNLPSPTELTYEDDREDIMSKIDLSHINLVELIEKEVGYRLTKDAKCHVGLCPFCNQGKDRFVVWPEKWWCRRCEKSGDAINFLMQRRGITFVQACKELGVTLAGERPNPRTINRPMKSDNQPSDHIKISPERESAAFADPAWTEAALQFSIECHQRLMRMTEQSGPAAAPLAYLYQRGLTDDTLSDMMIGYNHKDRSTQWGATDVFTPAGIVFPWNDTRDGLRRVNVRCDNGPDKYRLITGSAQALYMSDRIQLGSHVIITEGEIDALTIWQAYDRASWVCPVATGSYTHGRVARLIARLSLATHIQAAFDGDEGGEAATRWWTSISGKITALQSPFPHKDANALYCAALSDPEHDAKVSYAKAAVRAWIEGEAL